MHDKIKEYAVLFRTDNHTDAKTYDCLIPIYVHHVSEDDGSIIFSSGKLEGRWPKVDAMFEFDDTEYVYRITNVEQRDGIPQVMDVVAKRMSPIEVAVLDAFFTPPAQGNTVQLEFPLPHIIKMSDVISCV